MSKKRIVSLLILELGGLASLLVGLSWGAVLHEYATYLAGAENVFNLINPDHASLTHAAVAGIIGLGRFLLLSTPKDVMLLTALLGFR